MISVCFQGKPFIITVIQVYAPSSNAEEAEIEWFCEEPTRPTRPYRSDQIRSVAQSCLTLCDPMNRTNTQKRCPFHYRGLECKSRKSRDTWSNRQIWPWNTKWSREKANRVLPRAHTGHSKHPFPTTQEKTLHMDITRWSTQKSDWFYSLQPKMDKLYAVSKNKTGSWL